MEIATVWNREATAPENPASVDGVSGVPGSEFNGDVVADFIARDLLC